MASNQQVFLHINEGRTLWVPTHKAAPHEVGGLGAVILPQVSQQELVRSFYLFDTPIAVVADARFATAPNCKTPADINNAINQFRDRCTKDENFMMTSRYNPNHHASPAAAQPHVPTLPAITSSYAPAAGTSFPQLNNQPIAQNPYGLPTPFGYPMPMQPQQPMYGQQQQQHHMMGGMNMMMRPGGAAMPYGHHQHHHHHQHAYQAPYGGVTAHPPGYGHPGYGQQQPQQRGGPQGGQQGNAPGASRFQQIVFEKPQPIDVAVEIPSEVWDLYHQPNGRLYCATMPGARITCWLRNHTMQPSNYQRYVHCKGGISLMMKASAQDIKDSKPIELFDRQLCTHFLAHNYCSRQGCLHVHHNEAQLRHMIAAKHVLLQDSTKRERELMVDDIYAKDRVGLTREKEDFETRYAIVMAMPPTFVTGTPAHLLRGAAAITPDTQAAPNVFATNPPAQAMMRHDEVRVGVREPLAAPPPPPPPQQQQQRTARLTGPIGVASDSETDSSDTETSSDDSSSDDSSSSSSSSSASSDAGDDAAEVDEGLTAEERAAKAQLVKAHKKKLRNLFSDLKNERADIDQAQKKAFRRLTADAADELHNIRKREKKDRRDRKRNRDGSEEDSRRRSGSGRRR